MSASYAQRLLSWFDTHGRHDLPWQHPRTPYRVWLSEIMLQQTQVKVAIPYFERFIAALPTLRALAEAPLDRVLALWSGLGYYARARNLHKAAQVCLAEHKGELPRDFDALIQLPGIGRSTAGAILSQAWNEPVAILDGNVKRVLARRHGIDGWPGQPKIEQRLWAIADSLLPNARLAEYTQAQMDLGALLCTRHAPGCLLCPVNDDCVALAEGRVDELPTPKPAKALPERQKLAWLLLDHQGRVLLQRRPPLGIWAGLWSLPEADNETEADSWLSRHIQTSARTETLPPILHTFTHYRLTLIPQQKHPAALALAVGDNDELRWVERKALPDYGIPAPVRTLLEARLPD